jgi:hypothetical protein
MTQKVQELLDIFDALPHSEKHEMVMELLRRICPPAQGDLPGASLTALADELFCALDAQEAHIGEP